jgi:hypothetical protein
LILRNGAHATECPLSGDVVLANAPGGLADGPDRPRTDLETAHNRYAASHDPRLEAELLVQYKPLAFQLARRFLRRGEPLDDLRQVALLALLKALRQYDPGRGATFRTYAVPVILGALNTTCGTEDGLCARPGAPRRRTSPRARPSRTFTRAWDANRS